ncbi:MFS transporter [Sphingobium chungbukense]|uniref:Major facilitator superfamily (MFS) profile domain-containing protein n=1 Tax=Sphingobium chungbukense TaxID=56193 RepID=A0A0M3AP83_9SPHN|nr:MFS transporter [Sphingobium chungbukense]KKW91733.1 hypothetical protein YP76_11390 [Sphingobium chungbukense]
MSPVSAETARRGQLSWALADFAREPFFSFVLSLAFPPFFVGTLAADPIQGTTLWGYSLSATSFALILLAPLAGALADATGTRRPWIIAMLIIVLAAVASLWFATARPGFIVWTLLSVAVAQLAIELSRIYTDSLIPSVARPDETGRLSALGVGLGFAASILFLGLGYLASTSGCEDATVARALSSGSGIWLALFMLPCLFFCPQPPTRFPSMRVALREGAGEFSRILPRLMDQMRLRRFLIARMFYWDGTMCLFSFIAIVAATQLKWGTAQVSILGLGGLFMGALFGAAAGRIEARLGTYRTLFIALLAMLLLTIMIAMVLVLEPPPPIEAPAGLPRAVDRIFLALAVTACGALAIIMASSRSLLVAVADPAKLGEAFGLYVMIGRASSFVAPLLVAVSTFVTREQKFGVFGVATLLLVVGLVLLARLRNDAVRREAAL